MNKLLEFFYKLGAELAAAEEFPAAITPEQARAIGTQIGIDWKTAKFTPEALCDGMKVELEHGLRDAETDVTGNDLPMTAKIAWAHLKEMPDYYTRLAQMEKKANTGDGADDSPPDGEGIRTPVDKVKVREWLRSLGGPPTDEQVHAFAARNAYETPLLEASIYELAYQKARGS